MFKNFLAKLAYKYVLENKLVHENVINDDDLDFLQQHERRIHRIVGNMKRQISDNALMSVSEEQLKRRKYWIECLNYIKVLSSKPKKNNMNTDFRNMRSLGK
jgi:hypothetical protein